ncbi:hypothetical protein R1sor_023161 [Riccia sorocarpa]|uniref:Uncharacterized protein n=1 Tax=Riccia sorocarpa TaxID=122646 RepID=A0ABD3GLV8_9MARC
MREVLELIRRALLQQRTSRAEREQFVDQHFTAIMAPKKRRGSEITAPRSPVRRSLRRTVVDVPSDRRGGGESSRGTIRLGRDAGGRGGRGRGRGHTTHGEAASESESDSAGDAPVPYDPLGRPRRPLRRRMVDDISPEEEEEPELEPEEGAKPRRQVRERPLPEGPYRVSWIPIIDRTQYIRWGYLTSEAVYDASIACCMEFISSFNFDTSSGVVRGRRIRIDDELVRDVFDVPAGTRPISPCIRSSKLRDWMPIRDDVGKRPRTVSGRFLRYLQGRFPGCETPWDDTRLARYNISRLIAANIRRECSFVQTHVQRTQERAPEERRWAETFIGIPLTWIFLHLEIVTEAECEAGAVVPDGGFPLPGGDDSSSEDGDATHRDEAPSVTVDRDVLMDELTTLRQESDSLHAEIASLRKMGLRQPLVSPGESRTKTLVLDIFGLFVCVCRTHSDREAASSMGYTVHHLIDPQRSAPIYYVVRGDLTSVLDTLASVAERLTIWGIEECDRVRPSHLEREKLTPMKDFRRFYDYRVCTRDVLLVDIEVSRNSPNHPFSAVHPWPFAIGCDPIERLRRFWGQQPSEADRSIIWRSVSRAEGLVLAGLWPAVFGDVRPGDRPGADLVGSVVGEPSPRGHSDPQPLAIRYLRPVVVSGAEGSVGAVADPLPEPVVVSGAEGSVGAVADPLPEPVVDTGAEGSVGPIPDLSALMIAQTVAELDAEGSAAPPSDE